MEQFIEVMPEIIEQEITLEREPVIVGGSGTVNVFENGLKDVKGFEFANVQVPLPEGDIELTENGPADVYNYARAIINVQPSLMDKTITENGLYPASADGVQGYSKVTVNTGAVDDKAIPDYVTDGLVCLYDAINNTGNGFSRNPTVWKDLSGNNYDLIFNGEKESLLYCVMGTYLYNSDVSEDILMLEIVSPYNIGNGVGGYFFFAYAKGTKCLAYQTNGFTITTQNARAFLARANKLQTLTADFSNNKLYASGTECVQSGATNSWPGASIYGQMFRINEYYNGGYVFPIPILSVRAYSRVLTEEEIAHNLAVDVERWGIDV